MWEGFDMFSWLIIQDTIHKTDLDIYQMILIKIPQNLVENQHDVWEILEY